MGKYEITREFVFWLVALSVFAQNLIVIKIFFSW